MTGEELIEMLTSFVQNSADNYITAENAISEKVAGMKIFEAPILGFGSPDDEYFKSFKKSSIIGQHFLLPKEWLPETRTIISFFLPFSKAVKRGNRRDKLWPSDEWLHGRIEGQAFANKLCTHLQSELTNAGYKSLVPGLDNRFWSNPGPNNYSLHPELTFTSSWSERHVAFVCGLGTFGLSRGLITSKGIAGRLGSVLTELYIPPDQRPYQKIDEYCSLCGTCLKNCPVNAISIEGGKKHLPCSAFLDQTAEKYKPRYGCGKCQTGVPCESRIPKQRNKK